MKKDELDILNKAVESYVNKRGGKIIVIGGIEIQQWPDESQFNFRIAIRCAGEKTKPEPRAEGEMSGQDWLAVVKTLESERDRLKAELESEKKESEYWRNTEAKILATDLVAVRSQLSAAKEALENARRHLRFKGYHKHDPSDSQIVDEALQKLGETEETK